MGIFPFHNICKGLSGLSLRISLQTGAENIKNLLYFSLSRNGIIGNLDGTPIFNLLDFRPFGVQGVHQNLTEQGNTGNRLAVFLSN